MDGEPAGGGCYRAAQTNMGLVRHFHISHGHWEPCRNLTQRSECRLGAVRGSALKESISEG